MQLWDVSTRNQFPHRILETVVLWWKGKDWEHVNTIQLQLAGFFGGHWHLHRHQTAFIALDFLEAFGSCCLLILEAALQLLVRVWFFHTTLFHPRTFYPERSGSEPGTFGMLKRLLSHTERRCPRSTWLAAVKQDAGLDGCLFWNSRAALCIL